MSNPTPPKILSVAGSDPSGGAGIQADLKTIMALDCYGMAIPTLLTVQNTTGIQKVCPIAPQLLLDQLTFLLEDLSPDAIKIGALPSFASLEILLPLLEAMSCPIVWDPIVASSSGTHFNRELEECWKGLTSIATIITPNASELPLSYKPGQHWLLLTNGDSAPSQTHSITDTLYSPERIEYSFIHPRYETHNTHGTGCTLSTALACFLAKGLNVPEATGEAIRFTAHLLSRSNHFNLGKGHGALGHEFSARSFPRK